MTRPGRTPGVAWRLGVAASVMAVAVIGVAVYRQQAATSPGGGTPAEVRRPRHVVIVTVDTLRADRVGAYGWRDARTPAIDGLATRGARFDRAFAAAPITLPSHASLLSGLYPPGHGSRHNGMRVRDGVATLATVLREQGWATGAFVGAFPLDRRFGLNRGFLRYGDRMSRTDEGRLLNERSGRIVVDEALEWARSVTADQRMFLWVHLFEPHAPYEPNRSVGRGCCRQRCGRRWWRWPTEIVHTAGLAERAASTLVVVAGDHGEAFGEHGEISHSLFVYDTTLQVPLILAGPGIPPLSPPVSAPVSLVDVLPTVLDLCGLPRRDTDGLSLVPLLQGRPIDRRDLYAESFAPLLDFGWSSLRAIRSGSLKYIGASQPELFDVDQDPSEQHNLAGSRREEAQQLAARVESWAGAELPAEQALSGIDAGVRARLNALGYVSGAADSAASGTRPDPKDRRELAARLALVFSGELNGTDLRRALQKLADEDPQNAQVRTRLGYSLIDASDAGLPTELPGGDSRKHAVGRCTPRAGVVPVVDRPGGRRRTRADRSEARGAGQSRGGSEPGKPGAGGKSTRRGGCAFRRRARPRFRSSPGPLQPCAGPGQGWSPHRCREAGSRVAGAPARQRTPTG